MRILFVNGLTHFGSAGVQRETERLIAELLLRGAEVGLLADRVTATMHGTTHLPLPYPPPADADRRIADAITHYQPDVMHVIGGGVRLMWAADRAANDRAADGLPWAVTIHTVPPLERTARWLQGRNAMHYPLRNLLAMPSAQTWRRFLRRGTFARAVCHSPFVADAAAHAGCPADKLLQIALGCEAPSDGEMDGRALPSPDCLFEAQDTPRLVSVGGLVHHKGFHDYLRVVARLVRDHPRLRYVIMGDLRDPHYHQTLERLIVRLGLQAQVRLVPKASEAQRLATAARADLYVVPSHEEGFCLSYLEGAMLSPRTLGTRCGAIAQIADGDPTQQVVAPADTAALEQATRRLLAVPATPTSLAQRRDALLKRYDWQHHAEAHVALYHELVEVPVAVEAATAVSEHV